MSSSTPIKIGIIGGGSRGRSLLNSIIFNPELENRAVPAAVMDKNPDILREWKLLVDEEIIYSDLDSFLSNEEIDAVIIATPPHTHASITRKCLEIGLHTFSEVPMGLTLDELYAIIDAEKGNKGNNGKYFYGENYCYRPEVQFVTLKNKEGKIGEVYYAEGEYSHSVEHYMIEENFLGNPQAKPEKELDPEKYPHTRPTWRATFEPIKYGHHVGPVFYTLNKGFTEHSEYPVRVSAMGNMKFQKRFGVNNFETALCYTNKETVCRFTVTLVMVPHSRIMYSFWATRSLFESEYTWRKGHYYLEIPEEKAYYPARLQIEGKLFTIEELAKEGKFQLRHGGHGGGDSLMMERWIMAMWNHHSMEIDAISGAQMTAVGICASQSIKEKKEVEIPKFK